jgi:plasmid stabilization system protein ParE
MYQVVMMPGATQMLQDAYDWYELQKIGLGEVFLAEINNGIDKLESWPIAYSKLRSNYRQIILRTFPYVLVFEIVKNDVVIYAVFHTSRNPRKKFKK